MAQNDVFIVYTARNNLWLLETIHVRPKKIFWGHFFRIFPDIEGDEPQNYRKIAKNTRFLVKK